MVAHAAPVGAGVAEAHARFANGATPLAPRRAGRIHAPPPAELALQAGDVLAVLGAADPLRDRNRPRGHGLSRQLAGQVLQVRPLVGPA